MEQQSGNAQTRLEAGIMGLVMDPDLGLFTPLLSGYVMVTRLENSVPCPAGCCYPDWQLYRGVSPAVIILRTWPPFQGHHILPLPRT